MIYQKPGAHRESVENDRTEVIPAAQFQRPRPGPLPDPRWNGWPSGAEQDAAALGQVLGRATARGAAPRPVARTRKGLPPFLIGLVAALVVIVVGLGGLAVLSFKGIGPGAELVKDDGVKACEAIADVVAARREGRTPTAALNGDPSEDRYVILRRAFAGSRYQDLKTAGTEAIDLIRQIDSDQSLALVGAGQLVQKWSALAGACQNHGVTLPTLAELANEK